MTGLVPEGAPGDWKNRNQTFLPTGGPRMDGLYSSSGSRTAANVLGQLSGEDRDAASALIALFRQYGLESLAPKIISYVRGGYGSDTIMLLLQDTQEWKRRFRGNEVRRQAGMSVLSPVEYLATERAYRQVLQEAGLPKGFYDSYEDFASMIGRDMSAGELQGRATEATRWATNQDQATRDALRRLYGLGQGDLAAWALDPKRALPLIQKQSKAIAAGAAALRHGLKTSRSQAEHLADLGVTTEQAESGYNTIADLLPTFTELGKVYGDAYSQKTAEQEIFEGNAKAKKKREGLASQERAAFSGRSRGQVGRGSSDSSY